MAFLSCYCAVELRNYSFTHSMLWWCWLGGKNMNNRVFVLSSVQLLRKWGNDIPMSLTVTWLLQTSPQNSPLCLTVTFSPPSDSWHFWFNFGALPIVVFITLHRLKNLEPDTLHLFNIVSFVTSPSVLVTLHGIKTNVMSLLGLQIN